MNSLKPMLLTSLKSYDRSQFVKDVTAGIIVAIIALPLSIALALASGVGPEAGIFTAIVAGFVISALGGSSVQIAGPTAAFATIVAGIIAKDGLDGLVISTILAGIFLILMGFCHFGSLIKFIPIYDHNGLHFRNCSYDRDRAIERFLRHNLSRRRKTNRNDRKIQSICRKYLYDKHRCLNRRNRKSRDPDHLTDALKENSGIADRRYCRKPDGTIPAA